MKTDVKNNIRRNMFISGLIGFVSCILIYGINIFNFTNNDWLYSGGDLTQHYLGWVAFRNSKWFFPIGLTDQLTYPLTTSIIYTDSIPILAVIFKLFRRILPINFQYFGLWALICYTLNGAISAAILNKYIKEDSMVIIGSLFITFSFTVLQRMFRHTALAGHWLILLALLLLVYVKELDYKKTLIYLMILGMLCTSIHMYITGMDGIIVLGIACLTLVENKQEKIGKKIILSIIQVGAYIIGALVVFYILGGLQGGVSAGGAGLGVYSLNLNGFVNPQDKGRILRPLSQTEGQYEGFAYLGIGILLLGTVVLAKLLSNLKKVYITKFKIVIVAILIVATIVALSPVITLGEKVIITIPLPYLIEKALSIFRSSGRFAWVGQYIIILFIIIETGRLFDKRMGLTLLIVATLLQGYDLSTVLHNEHIMWKAQSTIEYDNAVNNAVMKELANNNIKHLVILNSYENNLHYPISIAALNNKLTTNRFYLARDMNEAIKVEEDKSVLAFPSDTAFVVKNEELANMNWQDVNTYIISDNLSIVSRTNVEQLENIVKIPELYLNKEYMFAGENRDIDFAIPRGLSFDEGQYAWTDGNQFILQGHLDTTQDKITAKFNLAGIYNDKQHVNVIINDEFVTKLEVTPESKEMIFDFNIPSNGILKLKLELPDATSPLVDGINDSRVLALKLISLTLS